MREDRLRAEYAAKVARGEPVPQQEEAIWYGFKWVESDVLGPSWFRAWVKLKRLVIG